MSYEILSSSAKYWSCHQCDWGNYLDVAIAFGWEPEGAFFKHDAFSTACMCRVSTQITGNSASARALNSHCDNGPASSPIRLKR
jgi:hypothetical protein